MKSTWYKVYNYGKKKIKKKTRCRRSAKDHGEFQQQSPRRLIDEYRHTNSRNDRWLMRLKLIQEENYSIENQKSYSR